MAKHDIHSIKRVFPQHPFANYTVLVKHCRVSIKKCYNYTTKVYVNLII